MAKLRGSVKTQMASINAALLLAVVSAKDHKELMQMILSISKSIDNKIKGSDQPININHVQSNKLSKANQELGNG